MSDLPKVHDRAAYEALIQKGYVWTGTGRCREAICNQRILWFRVMNNSHMPFDPGTYRPHFATCKARRRSDLDLSRGDRDFLAHMHIAVPKKRNRETNPQIDLFEGES